MNDGQRRVAVLINVAAGTAKRPDAVPCLRHLLATHLPRAQVELTAPGADLTQRARACAADGAEVVAVAGGDGSLNAVAQALVGTSTHLGVLPFGTLNHFARSIRVPTQLAGAVEVLRSGHSQRVDVGAVNDHYFLNNASLGVYPQLVELRHQQARSLARPFRLFNAATALVQSAQPLVVELRMEDGSLQGPVWLVFAGNNRYHLGILHPMGRVRLDEALLDVAVVPARRHTDLARIVLQPLLGRMGVRQVTRLEVRVISGQTGQAASHSVALDGEVLDMEPPLIFRSVPQALWVVMPPPDRGNDAPES
ncbi:MAG: hypothetical protein M3281_00140 [Chloroflexota bacterium]|nr:hypothetical protein [Chloroflexota bacterium]